MGKLVLYAYTTEKYLKDGWIKVGHTKIEIGEERIWNQFGTSNPGRFSQDSVSHRS